MHIISGYVYDVAICINGKPMANNVCMHTKEGYACKPERVKYGHYWLMLKLCIYYLHLTVRLYKDQLCGARAFDGYEEDIH